jgi:hypothetical protein
MRRQHGSVSDHYISIIPRDPAFVPSDEGAEAAREYLERIVPNSDEVLRDGNSHHRGAPIQGLVVFCLESGDAFGARRRRAAAPQASGQFKMNQVLGKVRGLGPYDDLLFSVERAGLSR